MIKSWHQLESNPQPSGNWTDIQSTTFPPTIHLLCTHGMAWPESWILSFYNWETLDRTYFFLPVYIQSKGKKSRYSNPGLRGSHQHALTVYVDFSRANKICNSVDLGNTWVKIDLNSLQIYLLVLISTLLVNITNLLEHILTWQAQILTLLM